MDFSNIYLFSDIDGTLGWQASEFQPVTMTPSAGLSAKAATSGSVRTLVTDITHFVRGLPVNLPCIINNGAAVCELPSGKILNRYTYSPAQAMNYAREIAALDPCIQVIGVNESGYYCLSDRSDEKEVHLIRERFPVISWDTFEGPFLKFLFSCPSEQSEQLLSRARGLGHKDVCYTWSGMSFEMIPAGINKGTGLLSLCAARHIPREKYRIHRRQL